MTHWAPFSPIILNLLHSCSIFACFNLSLSAFLSHRLTRIMAAPTIMILFILLLLLLLLLVLMFLFLLFYYYVLTLSVVTFLLLHFFLFVLFCFLVLLFISLSLNPTSPFRWQSTSEAGSVSRFLPVKRKLLLTAVTICLLVWDFLSIVGYQ